MNKNRIDKLTYIILNNVISMFGLRIRNDELVYIYRIPLDGCKNTSTIKRTLEKGNFHIIPITSDLTEVFNFVHLDRNEYEEGFKDMFTYFNWILKNCSYLTRIVIDSLEHGLYSDTIKKDEELKNDIRKFLLYVKSSHEEVKDNELAPAMLYYNIKENIIRNFFYNENLEKKFKKIKKTNLFKNELVDKFTGEKVKYWIPELKNDPKLLNIFSRAFIFYVTDKKLENFPDYLIDSETAEIRREVVLFYNYEFLNTAEYKLHILEGVDNENVIM